MASLARPVVITSISPALSRGRPSDSAIGLAYQKRCVQSWIDAGARVISVNNRVEVAMLDEMYSDVEFVVSAARRSKDNPKGLPSISELLQVGVDLPEGSVFAIANSDVTFRGDADVLKAMFAQGRGGCAFANRTEWAPHAAEPGLAYRYGYDFFVVDNTLVSPAELAEFWIGAPWWDYLFLFLLAARELPMTLIESSVISHSTHDQAWNVDSWRRGLGLTARRLRQLSEEEGPTAALLGHLCRSFEPGAVAGFAVPSVSSELGTILGAAMVAYIAGACDKMMWFDFEDVGAAIAPRGVGSVAAYVDPYRWAAV